MANMAKPETRTPARLSRTNVQSQNRTASVLTVTSTADSGPGSLRSALADAQSGDTIRFAPTLANQTITLTSGQLDITKTLTLDATGVDNLTISGNNKSRVFWVEKYLSFTLKNLTIANGRTSEEGGGIQVRMYSTLNVENSRFINNQGGVGGAIRIGYGGRGTILNSTFDGNNGASSNQLASGGAIATYGSGELIVKGSRFTNNRGVNGGAIYNLLGPMIVEDSVFLNNSSAGGFGGGAILTDGGNSVGPKTTVGGTIIIRGSWFEGNRTKGEGGAMLLYGYKDKILLENSTVINNVAEVDANGRARAGGLRANSELTIRNVTFANNTSAKQGGALWLDGNGLPINILNSTFSGNRVLQDAGGAMFLNTTTAPVNIVNSTIVNNSAGRASGAIWLNNVSRQNVKLTNSIVANNSAADRMQQQVGYAPQDGGGNIEFPGPVVGRRVAESSLIADPKLGELQNIGGVLLHPLLAGSPAINRGRQTQAVPKVDQRGANRDNSPDVGAFEFGATGSTPKQTSIVTTPVTRMGSAANDFLLGGSANDTLNGKEGADHLVASAGDDVLIGGAGADVLMAGSGRDRFVYNSLAEGEDIIKDFNHKEDVIDLRSAFQRIGYRPQLGKEIKVQRVGQTAVISVQALDTNNPNQFVKLATLENVLDGQLWARNVLF